MITSDRASAHGLGLKSIGAMLFALAMFSPAWAEEIEAQVGKVLKVSRDQLELDQSGATMIIGFVSSNEARAALATIEVGDEVRAEFGATRDGSGRSINKLLSIRRCLPGDPQCAADRTRQAEEREASERRHAASELKRKDCAAAMNKSLAADRRYLQNMPVSSEKETLARFDGLAGKQRSCASTLLRRHSDAVLAACRLRHCGDEIAGGCSHIAGYAVGAGTLEMAMSRCGV